VVINTGNDALDFNTLGLSYIIIDGRIDGGLQLVTPNTAGASVGINHAINYVTLTNLDLAGPGGSTPITMNGDNRGIDATAWNGSVYEPVNHLVVSHCRIHGQVNNLWLMNCYNTTIEYTKMYDSGAANSVTYHANVCATSGCTNITWRYNEIYNHQVEGIMCIFGGAANWYIYGNVWHDGMTGVSRVLEVQDGVEGPMFFYDNTVVNVALPSIERDLHVGISQLEWIVTAYALTFLADAKALARVEDIVDAFTDGKPGLEGVVTESDSVGAGLRDEYDEPLADLTQLAGVKVGEVTKPAGDYREHYGIPYQQPKGEASVTLVGCWGMGNETWTLVCVWKPAA